MDDAERWEALSALAFNVLYCLALTAMVLMAVPSLRVRLVTVAGGQAHAWRYGRWLASREPTPRWTSLLERDDLPQERPA